MYSEAIQGTKGLSQILNGLNNKKTAKHLAKIQKEIADMQFEYDKKEIKEATETNLRGILKQYATAKESLYEQKENVRMNLNFKSQMKGVEKDNNSYITDSQNKLESEFFENMRNTIENQKNDLMNISKQGIGQLTQVHSGYNNSISNINQTKIQAQNQANQLIMDGVMNVAEAIAKSYGGGIGGGIGGTSEISNSVQSAETPFRNKFNFGKAFTFNRGYSPNSDFLNELKLSGGF